MTKPRIAVVGTTGLPAKYGGWDQLMIHLVKYLKSNYQIGIYASSIGRTAEERRYNEVEIHALPLKANGIQSVLYDGVAIVHAIAKYDVILALGSSGCLWFPIARLFGKKIIWNLDGDESQRSKWGPMAKKFLNLSKHIGLKFSSHIISDNQLIYDELASKGFSSTLIAYGGDNAKYVPRMQEQFTAELQGVEEYAFKVCRIVPENNISLILDVFSRCTFPLVIVGNWGSSDYGIKTREQYSEFKNIYLLDPIYDQEKLDSLRANCSVYVHGHSVGGTNPSLVEAMHLGLACVVFDVGYNRETTSNKAKYFKNIEELTEIISSVEDGTAEISATGEALKNEAMERYKWEDIVRSYSKVIESATV